MHDEYVVPIYVTVTILFVVLFSVVLLSFWIYVKRQLRNREERQQMLAEQENKILLARIEEQERISSLISGEMHDHMGQVLAVIQMNLDGLKREEQKEKQRQMIENLRYLSQGLAYDMQTMSHLLNSDYIKGIGLTDSLAQEVAYIQAGRLLDCELSVAGAVVSLPPDQELLIFRIAQEAIHNAIKHSRASMLRVVLDYGRDGLGLYIEDNGQGFLHEGTRLGAGLKSMENRARLLNGTLRIESKPGCGCRVALEM